jgi:hypothetical protein
MPEVNASATAAGDALVKSNSGLTVGECFVGRLRELFRRQKALVPGPFGFIPLLDRIQAQTVEF